MEHIQKIFFAASLLALSLLYGGWDWYILPALLLAGASLAASPMRIKEMLRAEYLLLFALFLLLLGQTLRSGTTLFAGISLLPLYLCLLLALARQLETNFLWTVLLSTALLQALLGTAGVLAGNDLLAANIAGHWRAAGSTGYPLALLGIIASALPFLGQNIKSNPLLYGALGGLLLVAALLSSVRGGVALLVLSVVAFLCRSHRSRVLAISALGAGALFLLAQPNSWHGRDEEWISALLFSFAHPLGSGLGSWGLEEGFSSLFVHSLPLEVAAGAGLGAGAIVLLLFARWSAMPFAMLPSTLVGGALLLFDWAWFVPLVSACFVLSFVISRKNTCARAASVK